MYDPIIGDILSELVVNKNKLVNYYDRLFEYVRCRNDREELRLIREEELKHMYMLKSFYTTMIGGHVNAIKESIIKREVFGKYIEKIIYLETNIIKTTKSLILTVSDLRIRNGLYYIITDDQRHADVIIFFYSKYS